MNHNKKTIKHEIDKSKNKLKNSDLGFIKKYLTTENLSETLKPRSRIYTPEATLSMFINQMINEDGSCQNRVNKLALKKKKKVSLSTSAYCTARTRLSTSVIANNVREIGASNEKLADNKWKFRGKNIYLIDGTTITMPDTPANQKEYPHPKTQKEGLGFPVCRMVAIISLSTGAIIDASIGNYSGKGTGEQSLLRDILHNVKRGDIILADAMFSTYTLLTYVLEHGIDIVFVQNGARSRKLDFTKGEILADNDHIITIKKPKDNPQWMSESEIKEIPKEIRIREIRVSGKILITTMLCPKKSTVKTIKELYKERWHIEVDFRNIKITLGLKEFKCKSPKMVIKEMWTCFLAYNIIRTLMLESALYCKVLPRQISFKSTVQLYINYLEKPRVESRKLLKLISEKVIGNREGRIEPRLLKKRCNAYRLMMKPRALCTEEVKKNGHPKM